MTRSPNAPFLTGIMATFLQSAAVGATWLALVTLATGCFFAPRGAEAQPTTDDVIGFGFSMAIAAAAAAIAAFAIGGWRRWAIQLSLSVLLLGTVTASLLLYFLWLDPTFARQQMDLWSFQRLQHVAPRWAEQLAGYHGPLGAAVGIAVGAVAGLLMRFGRQRPRLATGTALAILFLFASDLGRQFAVDLVTWLGWRLRYLFVPGSISDDQISITGMIFGAIAGAVVAGLAMYATRSAAEPHASQPSVGATLVRR
jgi:hypothetical protein